MHRCAKSPGRRIVPRPARLSYNETNYFNISKQRTNWAKKKKKGSVNLEIRIIETKAGQIHPNIVQERKMRLMGFEHQYSNFVGQANSNEKTDTYDYISG